jgi:hypothetical protein
MPTVRKVKYDLKFVPTAERITRIENKLDEIIDLLNKIYGGMNGET